MLNKPLSHRGNHKYLENPQYRWQHVIRREFTVEGGWMIDLNEIHSLTDFQRNTKEYIGRLKESGKPLVLTVNGKAEVVVQDAASYQRTLERIEWAETIEGIQRGLDDVQHGRTKSIDQFANEMESKYKMHRRKR